MSSLLVPCQRGPSLIDEDDEDGDVDPRSNVIVEDAIEEEDASSIDDKDDYLMYSAISDVSSNAPMVAF